MKNGISHFHISCLPEVRTFPTIGVAAAGNGSRPDGPCGAVPIASIFELNASIGVLALAHPPRPKSLRRHKSPNGVVVASWQTCTD
jgi:hypothetical protein